MCIFTKNWITMNKIIFFLSVLVSVSAFSQDNFWTERDIQNIPQEDIINYETQVSNFSIYQLDDVLLKNTLQNAPLRFEQTNSDVIIEIPYSKGKFGFFEIFETQTLHPELAVKYPRIKSFVGKSRNDNGDRLRLTLTPQGIYGKIFSAQGSVYINPHTQNGKYFKVFYMEDASFPPLVCDFEDQLEEQAEQASSSDNFVDDSTFRLYRFAGSASGEYSTFHVNQAGLSNGTITEKKAAVLAAMTVSLDRVIGITENELSTSFQFIPQTDTYIYLNPATDPFTNQTNTGITAQQNQTLLASISSSYDIGHVFSTAPGGVAIVLVSPNESFGNICNNNLKGAAVSGAIGSGPVGDGFDLILAHEMGHQMGASHTQNNSCNRTDFSSFETGSGVTIMSYAGICSPNVETDPYDHYHSASLIQMFNVINNNACGQNTSISNDPPSIVPQPNYIIPRRTPFVLEANASDTDNDVLTYSWEQFDNEIANQPPSSGSFVGPLFRSFQPTLSNLRYFPKMETLLNNQTQTIWEVLPNVSRNMNYVVTVRDNNILGGQNVQDFVSIDVEGAAGPFKVTSQNTEGITWDVGDVVTITWDVAGTDANGINASEVDLILSTDGGVTFEEILLANTPNDGFQDITVPTGITSPNCRLMVKASDNIFFALNEEFFTVNVICNTDSNTNIVNVPDGTGGIFPVAGVPAESVINVAEDNIVQSIIVNLELTHPRLKDIDIELESPDGEIVQLWSKDFCDSGGLDIRYQDGAQQLPTINCGSIITGDYEPVDLLSNFNDGNTLGDWTLRVTDFVTSNTGTIDSWSIEVCSAVTLNAEEFSSELFTLYPNPTNDYVKLMFNQATNLETQIQLFDVGGRLIKSEIISNSLLTHELNVSDLNRGVYFVKVNQDKTETVKKLIVK